MTCPYGIHLVTTSLNHDTVVAFRGKSMSAKKIIILINHKRILYIAGGMEVFL